LGFRNDVVYPYVRVRLPLTIASVMPGIDQFGPEVIQDCS